MSEQTEFAERLRSVPDAVSRRFLALSDEELRARPAPNEWSPIEVAGHLIDKFRNWRHRVDRAASEDSPRLEPYDQDACVEAAGYHRAELESVLVGLREESSAFAELVERISDESLGRPCLVGDYGEITLRECVRLPLESVDDHLRQIDHAVTIARAG